MRFGRTVAFAAVPLAVVLHAGAISGTQALARPVVSQILSGSACPTRAVFLRLFGEVRGYPLGARGQTTPCTDIAGANTMLLGNGNGYGAIQTSLDGRLHALAFQSNGYGGLLIFGPNANGNVAPLRAVLVDQDHVALATDSKLNDFVVASQGYESDSCWYVVPNGQKMATLSNCDSQVQAIYGLATDPADELLVVGFDIASGNLRVDVFGKPASNSPVLLRTIEGPATQFPIATGSYFGGSFELATDPTSGEIYVYVGGATLVGRASAVVPRIEDFAANANGNAAPVRIIGGTRTQLPPGAFAADVVAADDRGRLYVSTQAPSILVFGQHAHGNVAPERTITDSGAPSQGTSVGIAVRTAR